MNIYNASVVTSALARVALLTVMLIWPTFRIGAQTVSQSSETVFTAGPAYREVIDETGRNVRVPQPVRRIVSLAPSVTETIYALGLQDRLVGDTDFCDFPADAQKKTKVGGAINPSLEVIAQLKPDLVLMTKHLNSLDTAHSLDALGIASYATDPRSVEEIISSTKQLSDVLGASEAGTTLTEQLRQRLAELQGKIGGLPPSRVLFIVWSDPLISIGKDTFIADALRRAGAISIIDSSQSWPQVNLEEVLRLQPEFLVFADSHSEASPRNFDVLSIRPAWRDLHAVQQRRYAVISDAVNRPAPRIVSAIEQLAQQLHPEVFAEKTKGPEPAEAPAVEQPRGNKRSSEKFAPAMSSVAAEKCLGLVALYEEGVSCAR
jgi:iron complex transport system substrate-binding protein